MINESSFCVAGYVATEPSLGLTPSGIPAISMRLAWTPRRFDKGLNEWTDDASCFANVKAYRKLAQHARTSLRKGDPVLVAGSLRIRDYVGKDGIRRIAVDVTATSIGHDLSRGVTTFNRLRPQAEQGAEEPESAEEALAAEEAQSAASAADGEADALGAEEIFDDETSLAVQEPVAAPF